MRGWLIATAVVLVAWLQVSWFGYMRPFGVMPNLVLVLVVLLALRANATPSLAAAIGGGLILDMIAGDHTFGLRIGFYVMVTFAIIAGRQLGLQAESALSGLAIVAVGTVIYDIAILTTIGAPLPPAALPIIGKEIVLNVIIAAALYVIRANIGRQQRTSLELGPEISR